MVTIKVNGAKLNIPSETSILSLLEQQSYHPDKVAVEMNGDILPKNMYSNTFASDGDNVEIVSFVGGG